MCYSGRCHFEDSMGDCKVLDFDKFKLEIGERACDVGGFADSVESEEYIMNNWEKFKKLQNQAYEKGLVLKF